jgi:aminoglycoside 3-N-acetyltransferase
VVHVTLAQMLETLSVPRNGILYVQSSTDWLRKAGLEPGPVMDTLRDWVGSSGTLVMPAYPFRTTHLEYLEGNPSYDVRRTPTAVGLIPELFRRAGDVVRSLDPDFCITAAGREAGELVQSDLDDPDPFGRASTYEGLIARGATLVGLGVSLNTNSFIHVIDSRMRSGYARTVYPRSFDVDVIGYDGTPRRVTRLALAPEFQQLTKPSEVVTAVSGDDKMFSSRRVNEVQFFRWDLSRWSQWCVAHAERALDTGLWPCWLTHLAQCPPTP